MNPGFTIPVLDHGFVRYLGHYGSDMTVVEAARVSYQSKSKGSDADRKLLEYLWKNKHTSPFEMVKLHLGVKLPIFVMRQYVRHRMQNLNEVSARYSQLPAEFYIPASWRKQDVKNKQGSIEEGYWNPIVARDDEEGEATLSDMVILHCNSVYSMYEKMLELGVAREMARFILPVNIYTEIQSVWDMKNLLHYISLRDDSHAQREHQEYGKAIATICTELFPWIMGAFRRYKFVAFDTEDPAGTEIW